MHARHGGRERGLVRGRDRGFGEELAELIRISRAVGSDPDLVQGGGGNTSVKTRDGRSILVKASGTALAEMDESRGWAELDLEALRCILSEKGLSALPPEARETRVLELLSSNVLRPEGARPSVESNLHALLDRVVIHTHPVGLNAFLCSRDSRRSYGKLIGKPRGEPLYVPYIDPGYTLAARMEREIELYRRKFGRPPAVVLLENHGLFVSAPEADECLALSRAITEAGRCFAGGVRVNPLAVSVLAKPARGEEDSSQTVRVRGALLRGGAAPAIVRRDGSAVAREFLRNRHAFLSAARGAFTPDQIVYCRTHPLYLNGRKGNDRGTSRDDRLAVEAYRRKHGLDPRVVLIPGGGVFYAAPDLGQLRVVAEVYRGAMTAILRSSRTGGPRFLTKRQAGFIEGWEVEAFRARLSAGKSLPLKGRIAVVLENGAGAARSFAGSGAIAAFVGNDRKIFSAVRAELGSSLVHLETDAEKRGSVLRAIKTLAASFGGIDYVLAGGWPEAGSPEPPPPFIHEALDLLIRQGAGGWIDLGGIRIDVRRSGSRSAGDALTR